jgi:hypothetical protein
MDEERLRVHDAGDLVWVWVIAVELLIERPCASARNGIVVVNVHPVSHAAAHPDARTPFAPHLGDHHLLALPPFSCLALSR